MHKQKYTILITIGITFIIFLGFHISKEHSLPGPINLFKTKLDFAADIVTDASKSSNQHSEATLNDWDRLLHKVIDQNN